MPVNFSHPQILKSSNPQATYQEIHGIPLPAINFLAIFLKHVVTSSLWEHLNNLKPEKTFQLWKQRKRFECLLFLLFTFAADFKPET